MNLRTAGSGIRVRPGIVTVPNMTDFEKEWELFKAAHEEKPLTHEEFVRSVQDACL